MAKKKILMRGKDDEFGNTYMYGRKISDKEMYEALTKARHPSTGPYISGLTGPAGYGKDDYPGEWCVQSSKPTDPTRYVDPEEEVSYILGEIAKLSDAKRRDYAGEDADSNFQESAAFAADVCKGISPGDRRWSTAVLIGVKLARLRTLGLAGVANNESVDDTIKDLIAYSAILLRQQKRAARGN